MYLIHIIGVYITLVKEIQRTFLETLTFYAAMAYRGVIILAGVVNDRGNPGKSKNLVTTRWFFCKTRKIDG